jgi:hypothetical protein
MHGGRLKGAGRRFPVSMALALLGVSTLLSGRTITVDDDGPAEFSSIQPAINAAVPGDVVSVAAGLYRENLVLKNGVSVIGAGADQTTVDGGSLSWVATLLNCDASTRLQGFTLTNGKQQVGAGVYVLGGAPVITLNHITGNTAVSLRLAQGGGIALQNSQAIVSDNLISNNHSDWGAGVEIVGGSPLITRNQITGNVAGEQGGGVDSYATSATSPVVITGNAIFANDSFYGGGLELGGVGEVILTNNLITGNTATGSGGIPSYGGGLEVFYGNAQLANNTFAGNKADIGGGAAVAGLDVEAQSLSNNIFYDNTGSVESGGLDLTSDSTQVFSNVFFSNQHTDCGGTIVNPCSDPSNLFKDPLLVDPRRSDYRLQPGSPAIDSGTPAGAPADDYRGQQRPLDGNHDGVATVDRGAYEFDRNDVLGLIFTPPAALSWPAAPGAAAYHVYSGTLGALASRGLDTCRAGDDPVLTDLLFTESRTPLPGSGFAYVVVAVTGGVEQSPGFDSRGIERTLPLPCP